MKGTKKTLWLAAALVLVGFLIVPSAFANSEQSNREPLGKMPYSGPIVASGESATGVLDETLPSSDYQRGYQEGYQAGYYRGLMDAFQWMITKIQEQMTGIPLEGPKIKQAVDVLTPQVGALE